MSTTSATIALARAGLVARRALSKRLAPWRLSPIQYEILRWLSSGHWCHPRELGRRLHLNRQSVLSAAAGLVERGLVGRTRHRDARLVMLDILPAGRELLHEIAPVLERLDEQIRRSLGMGARDPDDIVAALQRVPRLFFVGKEMTWSD